MVEVKINVEKGCLFVVCGIFFVIGCLGLVYGVKPSVLGHTFNEIRMGDNKIPGSAFNFSGVEGLQKSISGVCGEGEIIKSINENGSVVCESELSSESITDYVETGLYGYCRLEGSSEVIEPAFWDGDCKCRSGFFKVLIGDGNSYEDRVYSCYRPIEGEEYF